MSVAIPCIVTTLTTDSLIVTLLMGLSAIALLVRVLRSI